MANKFRTIQLYLSLALAALLLLWLNQNSFNGYWQAQYHRPSPLERLDGHRWWQRGGQLQQRLAQLLSPRRPPPAITAETAPVASDQARASSVGIIKRSNYADWNPPEQLMEEPAEGLGEVLVADNPAPAKAVAAAGGGAQVLLVGDSIMMGIAPQLQRLLQRQHIDSLNLSKQSTGLVNNRHFNWAEKIRGAMEQHGAIHTLVIFVGPNDPWDIYTKRKTYKFATADWAREYARRMGEIIALARQYNLRLIWVEIPAMKDPAFNGKMDFINGVIRGQAASGAFDLIPTRQLLGEQYQEVRPVGKRQLRIRGKDGIHFTGEGYRLIAEAIKQQISP